MATTRRRVSVRYNGVEDERYLGYEEDHTVYFDDGEVSQNVDPAWITYVEEVTSENARIGLRVEARVPDDNRVYPGEIVAINVDGNTFGIAFDDGDRNDAARDVVTAVRDEDADLWDQILEDNDDDKEEQPIDLSTDNHPQQIIENEEGFASPQSYSSCENNEQADTLSNNADSQQQQQQVEERRDSTDCWGFRSGDSDDLGRSGRQIPTSFTPKEEATLSRQLRTMRTSLTAIADASPDLRLAQLQYEAATLEQAKTHHERAGRTWKYGGVAPCLDWNSTSAAITHVDALLQLRMRAVAVCRIRYGSTSLEIVQAVLDLSQAYAQNKLWVQACNHAERALHILRLVETPGKENFNRNETEEDVQNSLTLSPAVQELFERLGTLSCESEFGGVFPWSAFVATLNSIGVQSLAEQPWGIRQGGSPSESCFGRAMKWSGAVTFLRKHHRGFAAAVRKVERSIFPSDLALLLFVFDAASKTQEETGGVVSPVALRAAVVSTTAAAAAFADTGFSRWLAEQCQRELEATKSRSDAVAIPITWEQTVCAFRQTTDVKASRRIADLRGAAALLIGRAHASDGRLAKARSSLRRALSTVEGGATASAAHTALADVLVAEHVAWERTADERARKKSEEWLATEEGHRIWREEVKRLIAEMRIKGTPGLVQLTRPEIECRARDVLLHARAQYIKKSSVSKRDRLETARTHLKAAVECEKAIYGVHTTNIRAAIAKSALGTLAVASGDFDEAIAIFSEALSALLAAAKGKHNVTSAAIAEQLGRILRRNNKSGATSSAAPAAECFAAAAQFNLDLARDAEAESKRYASLNAMTETAQLTHSHRVALASEVRSSAAQKARSLWNEVVVLIDNTFAGRYEENMADALEKVYAATKLAEGESSTSAMKALRKLAKFQAENSMKKEATATYQDLQKTAMRVGDSDTANKASKAARHLKKSL